MEKIKPGTNTGIKLEDWEKKGHEDKDYYIGSSPVGKTVLFTDSQEMAKYLPPPEFQNKGLETMACVSFSHNNCIEILSNYYGIPKIVNKDVNISDRALAKMSNTTAQGNSPNNVCETFRKKGFLWEIEWPFPDNLDTWGQFYSSIPYTKLKQAEKNMSGFQYSHEWVDMNHEEMKESLQYGPIQGIGYSWVFDNDRGVYIDAGYSPNHAFVIFGYVEGKYWLVYDTYALDFIYDDNSPKDEFIKKLDWNFKFGPYGKQMTFLPTTAQKKTPFLILLMKSMENFYYYWDTTHLTHNFFYIGVPHGETRKYRQAINWADMDVSTRFVFLALRGAMKQSSWPEVSKYPDISSIGKKFA